MQFVLHPDKKNWCQCFSTFLIRGTVPWLQTNLSRPLVIVKKVLLILKVHQLADTQLRTTVSNDHWKGRTFSKCKLDQSPNNGKLLTFTIGNNKTIRPKSIFIAVGPRHTQYFCTQYFCTQYFCTQYCDKKIFFNQYFFHH